MEFKIKTVFFGNVVYIFTIFTNRVIILVTELWFTLRVYFV